MTLQPEPKRHWAFRVFVASPSDVRDFQSDVMEAVRGWNADNSAHENAVLVPVSGFDDPAPDSGAHPQDIINGHA